MSSGEPEGNRQDLEGRLAEAEATIQALLSGQVDAVFDSRIQTPVLLSQAQEALRESAERYRVLFDLSPLPKWLYDIENLRFLEVNQAAVRHYGYSRAEFLLMTIMDIRPPADVPNVAEVRSLADGAAQLAPGKHRKKDGTLIDVEITGHVFTIDGRSCRLVVANDVTERNREEQARARLTRTLQHELEERKRVEQALRISETRFARLWESGIIGIAVTDLLGNIHDANGEYLRTIGYSEEDLRRGGLRWDEMTPPEWRDRSKAAVAQLVAGGSASPWEKEVIRKDGSRVPVLVGVAGLDVAHCITFQLDYTERKQAELELRERVKLAALSADIGLAVTQADSLQDMLQRCAGALVDRLGVAFARIWTLNADQGALELQASAGDFSPSNQTCTTIAVGEGTIGRIAGDRKPQLTNDLQRDLRGTDLDWACSGGMVAIAGHPLLIGGELVGVMALLARHPLGGATIEALAAKADAIALGIRRKTVENAKSALEAQLRQAQKIEAIGQLSGGIAHDFNNLLSVILSRSCFLLEELGDRDPRREDAQEIKAAAERAALLTRQLLAFSRKQVLELRVLDLNSVLGAMEKMLGRLIGEDIALSIDAAQDLGSVKADAGQFEQVIMNLAVNARDAMPGGGKLTLKTANVQLRQSDVARHPGLVPGAYVRLSVSDTGEGMTAEAQQHLFEPFFTTKAQGKGTGLGLSTSYGIVKQSGGYIWADSEPGVGTVFSIYLPRVDEAPQASERTATRSLGGSETILLTDDDDHVRAAAERILKSRGYTVLSACNAPAAVAMAARHPGEIQLVLSDVVMPGGSGVDLARRLRAARPDIAVLLMSGFTEHAVVDQARAEGANHLQKPFTPETLANRVRLTLDRARRS